MKFNNLTRGITLFPLLISALFATSQVTINNTNTVAWYVQNVLLGANVTVSNITYNGSVANASANQPSVGEFSNPGMQVGLSNGMIMGTGNVNLASQPNLGGGSSSGNTGPSSSANDVSLATLISGQQYDKCIIEFDFIPTGDSISFSYVFASEEYPEYVCSGYNDVFGFFLTGPNPLGGNYTSLNLARVPNSLNPLSFTSTPVAINTINPGVSGSNGTSSNCSSIDPNWSTYNVYYSGNTGTAYEYDGRTVALPVAIAVNCGDTYHIKLAIADIGDGLYDSGVFLEAGSFSSNGISAAGATAPGDTIICGTDLTMNFNAGPDPAPINFWDFGDGSGTSTQPNPTYTYADTGYYQVMYVASSVTGSCVSRDTAYFDVNLIYPEQFNAQFDIPVIDPCDGLDSLLVELEFTGTGADSIIWNMGNGDIYYNLDSVDYYYTNQGTYTITMTAFDLSCNNSQSFTETFDYTATFSLANAVAPPDTSFCGPPPYDLNFTANSSTPNHYWDFGDGSGSSTQANPSYTYSSPGNYSIMYVAIDSSTCNIADTVYFTVDISQAEELSAQFNLPAVEPCTTPDSVLVSLAFTGTGADSLSWNMGDGTIFNDVSNVSYYYSQEGQYIITMQAWDFYCNVFEEVTDTVNFFVSYSEANAEVPEDIFLCSSPLIVNFSSGQNPPPDAYWDFGDGSGSSVNLNPSYTYSSVGNYQVMYVAIDSSTCNIADTAYFNVALAQAETFSAELSFTPPPPCGSDSALVYAVFTGSGADSIVWDMGNGDIFNSDSIYYFFTEPGVYEISMTAYDNLCNHVETISDTVRFAGKEVSSAAVPNIFTPNGDGENDLFIISGIDASADFHMVIYNRWGRKIFETEENGDFWDGQLWSGIDAADGVYYFEVTYRDICTDENKVQTGHLTLKR